MRTCFFLVLLIAVPLPLFADSLESRLQKLIEKAPGKLSLEVRDLESSKVLYAEAAHVPRKPASVLKILVSGLALREFGPDYRISTKLFVDGGVKGGEVHALSLVGGGDPTLTTNDIYEMARVARGVGITKAETLFLDTTLFADSRRAGGHRAYESGSSALALNFNSLAISSCQVGEQIKSYIEPRELGLPLKQQVRASSRETALSVGVEGRGYTVSGSVAEGCATAYRSAADLSDFSAAAIKGVFSDAGIDLGRVAFGRAKGELLYAHASKRLGDIIRDLHYFSTNMIAHQLAYLVDPEGIDGGSLSFERGVQAVEKFGQQFTKQAEELQMVDTSGLDHDNRASVAVLNQALARYYRDISARSPFLDSLPVYGKSGTVKSRRTEIPDVVQVRVKTGSLDGVSSLAGYILCPGKTLSFALILNDVDEKSKALQFENRVVSTLAAWCTE